MKHSMRMAALILPIVLITGIATGALLHHISGPRIVGRAVAPDGTEICVVQKCNWNAEPFTTTFYFRKPKAEWRAFYFDHQDLYWRHSVSEINTNSQCAVFYRGGAPAITFLWQTETFTLHRWNRTLTGAQWKMPEGWEPP